MQLAGGREQSQGDRMGLEGPEDLVQKAELPPRSAPLRCLSPRMALGHACLPT